MTAYSALINKYDSWVGEWRDVDHGLAEVRYMMDDAYHNRVDVPEQVNGHINVKYREYVDDDGDVTIVVTGEDLDEVQELAQSLWLARI